MTSLFTRRRPGADPVAYSKLKPLGRVRGTEFAEYGGREFMLDDSTSDDANAWAVGDDALVLVVPRVISDPVTGQEMTAGSSYRHALLVPNGTYAAAKAKADARRAPAARRPIDSLDVISLLASRPPLILGGSRAGASPVSLRGSGGMDPGRSQVRGRDIVTALQARGITLSAGDGRLLASAPGGHADADIRALLDIGHRLLIGYLADRPLGCELRHDGKPPEAWSVAVGGALMCEAHADGTVEL